MSGLHEPTRDELLPDAALGWTDGADAEACATLLQDATAQADLAAFERTAALAALALAIEPRADGEADLPRLTAKLHANANAFFATTAAATTSRATATPASARPQPLALRTTLPWLLAAASLLLLLWPRREAVVTAEVARADLLRSGAELMQWNWQPGPSPRSGPVQGDVVWDGRHQNGYLRLRGLPELDQDHRYQLWIVDASRQGPPVDGGVLTLPAGSGEVIVPVQSRLPVQRAAAFVLTIEPAAGVVVSAQDDVVAIAKP